MFQQSITGRILLWLKSLFMQYDASLTYRAILRAANAIKAKFISSGIYHSITTPSKFEARYTSSLFYTFLSAFWQAVLSLLKKLTDAFARLLQGSFISALSGALQKTGVLRFEYLCAGFFGVMLLVPHDYWNNLYAFIGALALSAIHLLRLARTQRLGTNIRAIPLSLFVFALSIVVSIAITPVHADGLRIALFFLSSVLFMLLCMSSMTDQKAFFRFLSLLLSALGILCVFAIIQRFIGVEANPEFTDLAANEGMPGRVYATMSNPNNFAEIVVLLLPFVFAAFLNTKAIAGKLLWTLVAAVCVVALTMSYSRSCYVAFAISILLFIALYDWRWLLPLGILAIACIPLLPETVMNRILTIGSMSDTSNASRIFIWEGVLAMLKDYLLTGIGIGPEAFAEIYPTYASHWALTAPHSHMLYLEIFVELGLLGGISFLVFMFSTIKKGLATYNHTDKAMRNIIIAGIAALGGISFVGAAEYIWFYPRVMFVFWITVGILLCAIRFARKNNTNQ